MGGRGSGGRLARRMFSLGNDVEILSTGGCDRRLIGDGFSD